MGSRKIAYAIFVVRALLLGPLSAKYGPSLPPKFGLPPSKNAAMPMKKPLKKASVFLMRTNQVGDKVILDFLANFPRRSKWSALSHVRLNC